MGGDKLPIRAEVQITKSGDGIAAAQSELASLTQSVQSSSAASVAASRELAASVTASHQAILASLQNQGASTSDIFRSLADQLNGIFEKNAQHTQAYIAATQGSLKELSTAITEHIRSTGAQQLSAEEQAKQAALEKQKATQRAQAAQAQALQDIAILERNYHIETLSTMAREEAEAQDNYTKRKAQINDLARLAKLSEAEIARLHTQNAQSYSAALSRGGASVPSTPAATPSIGRELLSYAGLATGIGATVTIGGNLIRFLQDSVRESLEAEEAFKRFNAILANTGHTSIGVQAAFAQLTQSFARTSVVSDTEITKIQGDLIGLKVPIEQIARVTRAALDLSAGLRIDLSSAVTALGRAAQGETQNLSRFGFVIADNKDKTAQFESVLRQIETRFRGLSQGELQTVSGQLKQQAKEWNAIKQAIGDTVAAASPTALKILGAFGTQSGILGATAAAITTKATSTLSGDSAARKAELETEAIRLEAVLRNQIAIEKSAAVEKDLRTAIAGLLRARLGGSNDDLAQVIIAANAAIQQIQNPPPVQGPTAEEVRKALAAQKEFAELAEKLSNASLEGYSRQRAEIDTTYRHAIKRAHELAEASGATPSQLSAALAHATQAKQVAYQEIDARIAEEELALQKRKAEELYRFEKTQFEEFLAIKEAREREVAQHLADFEADLQLRSAQQALSLPASNPFEPTSRFQQRPDQSVIHDFEFRERITQYQQLLDAGRVTEEEYTRLSVEAARERTRARADEVRKALEDERNRTIEEHRRIRAVIEGELRGMSGALSRTLVDGFATGRFEMQRFFADLLRHLGESILQALIFRTIIRAIGGSTSGGSGAIGDVVLGAIGLAKGGIAFSGASAPRMAANGIVTVDTATLLPRFNVVAGEAGREMLTVLSQPRTSNYNGFPVVSGSAQGSPLSLIPTPALSSNPSAPSSGTQRVDLHHTTQPQSITLQIVTEPGFRADIIEQSTGIAVQLVDSRLHSDTPTSRQVRALART